MIGSGAPFASEALADVLEYLAFAGVEMSRDQLSRLQRRGVAPAPLDGAGMPRAAGVHFAPGTAERLLRAAQLRAAHRQVDEVLWRLWWEGHPVDLDAVRAFLTKRAERWDELVGAGTPAPPEPSAEEGRDVLEDVFFKHLRSDHSLVAARKRVVRGTELYVDLVGLIVDLVNGVLEGPRERVGALFATPSGPTLRPGARARFVMRKEFDAPYGEVAASLADAELAEVRDVAAQFLAVIARLGRMLADASGSRAREGTAALAGWAQNPDEQVLALLLTAALVRDERARAALPAAPAPVPEAPALTYRDFVRLRFLGEFVPGVAELLSPERGRRLQGDPEAAGAWRMEFEALRLELAEEFAWAVGEWPELFDLAPPSPPWGAQWEWDEEEPKKKMPRAGRR